MDKLVEGRAAVVTGAAQGIGLAIVEALTREGARVVMGDIDDAAVTVAAAQLTAAGAQVIARRCDVTKEAEVAELVNACVSNFGTVDIFVNNAGITRDGYLSKLTEADFDSVVGVSLKGAWLGIRAASSVMRAQRSGTIVSLSSLSGKVGNPGQTNYSAAKAGIVGLTKAAAKELGGFGIRVNAVQPGLIATEMTLAMPAEIFSAKEREAALQRAGSPAEVANVVVFLASSWSSFITGEVIEVTGGRGM
jgi:3-oxoacyl-[acyl-carrier protein] reductase